MFFMKLCVALLAATLPLWSAEEADAILKKFIAVEKSMVERANQFTYLEETDRMRYENGQKKKLNSETHEIVFVEGLEYRKMTARNGKPLSGREQARVEKEMRETAEERRKHWRPAAPGGRIFTGRKSADLGSLEELLTLYENRVVGEESIGARKAWVIESSPRRDLMAKSQHERDVLSYQKKFWIDQEEYVGLRRVFTVVGEHAFARPGSTITTGYIQLGLDVWHANLVVLDVYEERGKDIHPWLRTEYKLSRFKKFDVESTMTPGPPQ